MGDELLKEYFTSLHQSLNKVEFVLDNKNRIYLPLFLSSIEHSMSIWVLNNQYLTTSMYTLVRPAIETYLRAMWVKYCVDGSSIDEELTSMHFPKKLDKLIELVDEAVPDFKCNKVLATKLKPLLTNAHDFTHGGLQSIARQYTGENMLTNIRSDEELVSTLNLAVMMSCLAFCEIELSNIGIKPLNTNEIGKLAEQILSLNL